MKRWQFLRYLAASAERGRSLRQQGDCAGAYPTGQEWWRRFVSVPCWRELFDTKGSVLRRIWDTVDGGAHGTTSENGVHQWGPVRHYLAFLLHGSDAALQAQRLAAGAGATVPHLDAVSRLAVRADVIHACFGFDRVPRCLFHTKLLWLCLSRIWVFFRLRTKQRLSVVSGQCPSFLS